MSSDQDHRLGDLMVLKKTSFRSWVQDQDPTILPLGTVLLRVTRMVLFLITMYLDIHLLAWMEDTIKGCPRTTEIMGEIVAIIHLPDSVTLLPREGDMTTREVMEMILLMTETITENQETLHLTGILTIDILEKMIIEEDQLMRRGDTNLLLMIEGSGAKRALEIEKNLHEKFLSKRKKLKRHQEAVLHDTEVLTIEAVKEQNHLHHHIIERRVGIKILIETTVLPKGGIETTTRVVVDTNTVRGLEETKTTIEEVLLMVQRNFQFLRCISIKFLNKKSV
jgi:hypothetical protein